MTHLYREINQFLARISEVESEAVAREEYSRRTTEWWRDYQYDHAAIPEEEQPKIREAIDYLIPAVECIVTHDVDMAMNQFNPKKKKKAKKVQAAEVSEAEAKEEQHEQAE